MLKNVVKQGHGRRWSVTSKDFNVTATVKGGTSVAMFLAANLRGPVASTVAYTVSDAFHRVG
jgi:hypothetical protein